MQELIKKVQNGKRVDAKEALNLYELDLFTLGKLASLKREALHGKKTFYNINRHINPTNICKDICKFCAFSANRKNPNQYTMTFDEILSIADEAIKNGAKELHIVSAHNNKVGLDWYMDMFKVIKKSFPDIHPHFFTAVELWQVAKTENKPIEQVLQQLWHLVLLLLPITV